jgi:hypothetical protein
MFADKEKPRYQRMIETEIERALSELKLSRFDSEDYTTTLGIAERLHDMVDKEKTSFVTKDALLTVGGNLLGILLIIRHENVNVITSKALGFVTRLR